MSAREVISRPRHGVSGLRRRHPPSRMPMQSYILGSITRRRRGCVCRVLGCASSHPRQAQRLQRWRRISGSRARLRSGEQRVCHARFLSRSRRLSRAACDGERLGSSVYILSASTLWSVLEKTAGELLGVERKTRRNGSPPVFGGWCGEKFDGTPASEARIGDLCGELWATSRRLVSGVLVAIRIQVVSSGFTLIQQP